MNVHLIVFVSKKFQFFKMLKTIHSKKFLVFLKQNKHVLLKENLFALLRSIMVIF